jgi:hypothetical protein
MGSSQCVKVKSYKILSPVSLTTALWTWYVIVRNYTQKKSNKQRIKATCTLFTQLKVMQCFIPSPWTSKNPEESLCKIFF